MRRANEKLLEEYILDHMEEAKPYIQRAAAIFLHAPGFNKNLFLSQTKSLQKYAHKVRSIEFKSSKANFQEAKDLVAKIIEA